ncbi:MAG: hypothetical protein Q4E74_05540 [Ruminococcus sp.]|nr:hypothetical protein [Ruminococcus sp.]
MISIYDWFGYDVPIQERYKLIKEAGFDGVLLWWSDGFGRGEDYRRGAELARKSDLIIENIHAPVQEQNDLSIRRKNLRIFLNMTEPNSVFCDCISESFQRRCDTDIKSTSHNDLNSV